MRGVTNELLQLQLKKHRIVFESLPENFQKLLEDVTAVYGGLEDKRDSKEQEFEELTTKFRLLQNRFDKKQGEERKLQAKIYVALKQIRSSIVEDLELGLDEYVDRLIDESIQLLRLEKELQKSEERYRRLVETAKDIIFKVDTSWSMIYANPIALKYLGVSRELCIGKSFIEFIREDFQENFKTFYASQLEENRNTTYFEFPVVFQGKEIWLGQNCRLIRDNRGKITEMNIVARDITQIKSVQKDLNIERTKAEQQIKTKERFLANMSHEIRTPMNAILGMSQVLMDHELTKDERKYVEAIKTSADGLLVIINDILDFSKIESGHLNLERTNVQLSDLLKEVMGYFEFQAKKKRVNLMFELDEVLPTMVVTDPVRLKQILINLVNNALKFTAKGDVSLHATNVGMKGDEYIIKFEVRDTGIGIDSGKLQEIFKPYCQEENSTTRKYGGTGLGLSISSQLVQLLGGMLDVESKKGIGSNFHFTIKMEEGEEKEEEEIIALNISNTILEKKKVLLVEDHELNRFLAQTVLSQWGMEVDMAENGLVAIELLKVRNYDLILMDMQMPEMDGIQTTEYIREKMKLEVPIIALTANALKNDNDICIKAGMNDYVAKPFDLVVLRNKVVSSLEGKTLRKIKKIKSFDLKQLKDVSKGNKFFLRRFMQLFIDQVPTILESFKYHIEQNNFVPLKRTIEKLRKEADRFEMDTVLLVLLKLEQMTFDEFSTKIAMELYGELEEHLTIVLHQMKKEILSPGVV